MAKKRAFVKYTKKGKIIPGSLIVTTSGGHPVDGVYKEVPYDVCCELPPTCKKYVITGEIDTDIYPFTDFTIGIQGLCIDSVPSLLTLSVSTPVSITSPLELIDAFNQYAALWGNFSLVDSQTISLEFACCMVPFFESCETPEIKFYPF